MNEKKLFCKEQNVKIVSEILNLFIAEMFPRFLKKIQAEKVFSFKYLDFEG